MKETKRHEFSHILEWSLEESFPKQDDLKQRENHKPEVKMVRPSHQDWKRVDRMEG